MPFGDKNKVIQHGGVHHIAIQTRDYDQSMQFYRDLLGMEFVVEFKSGERRIALLDVGDGAHIELFEPTADSPKATAPDPGDPVIHFALATTDVPAATELVREAGYEVTVEPREAQLGHISVQISFFKGPNGEIIEFFHQK